MSLAEAFTVGLGIHAEREASNQGSFRSTQANLDARSRRPSLDRKRISSSGTMLPSPPPPVPCRTCHAVCPNGCLTRTNLPSPSRRSKVIYRSKMWTTSVSKTDAKSRGDRIQPVRSLLLSTKSRGASCLRRDQLPSHQKQNDPAPVHVAKLLQSSVGISQSHHIQSLFGHMPRRSHSP